MKKIVALLLVFLTVLPMAVACAETSSESSITTNEAVAGDPSDSKSENPESTDIKSATLPDNLNFNGEKVVILSLNREFVSDEVSVEQTTGAIVNYEIYKRNARVSRQLGITIEN